MLDCGECITAVDYRQGNGNGYDQLSGDWGVLYKVARYFIHKVKFEDRKDFLHDLMLTTHNLHQYMSQTTELAHTK